jgi:predicted GNAT family N-acyltransferase
LPVIDVRPLASDADRAGAYEVRRRVFQDEQGVPAELEFDADDETALHVVAVARDRIVGTGRLVMHTEYAKIGRMAVLAEWRGRAVGRALLARLIDEAARRGAPRAVLHAQVQAIGFYARAGFAVVGDEFEEAGIPHRRMERALA